ncbi:hypothetical protein LFYK43_07650 [Ligilactobacillus salitolerans]|uniref:Uncharacterized protein n=1 Tax=Ligilactobacillus salitolerans TaxID=1808352 RepID=A0A401IS21_9LACO|nr:hypothetical protein LFYK43_07650 [Ligilactobacillus salitolerans]
MCEVLVGFAKIKALSEGSQSSQGQKGQLAFDIDCVQLFFIGLELKYTN